MKKMLVSILIAFSLVLICPAAAQDLQATSDYLQAQIEILQLQATLDALQGQTAPTPAPPSPGGGDEGIYIWNPQNSPYSPSPTPFNYQQSYDGAINKYTFPSQVRPPVPLGPPPTWQTPASRYYTELYVGDAGQYSTIAEAVKHIPDNAGEVVILLVSDTDEPQSGVSLPLGKKISSLRIASNDEETKRTVYPKDRSLWFFCNGIPLIIDRTVEFARGTMIMGGTVTYSGHNVQVPSSTIIVNGKAYWVYAGGQSDRVGLSSTVSEAFVMINGTVDRVYAGGRAIWGETVVHNATVVVTGTASEVYCSGFTENAAAVSTVGRADMRIYGWYSKYGLGLGQGDLYLLNPSGCY